MVMLLEQSMQIDFLFFSPPSQKLFRFEWTTVNAFDR